MSCMIPACVRADIAEAMSTVTLNLITCIQQQSTVSLTYSCDTIVVNFMRSRCMMVHMGFWGLYDVALQQIIISHICSSFVSVADADTNLNQVNQCLYNVYTQHSLKASRRPHCISSEFGFSTAVDSAETDILHSYEFWTLDSHVIWNVALFLCNSCSSCFVCQSVTWSMVAWYRAKRAIRVRVLLRQSKTRQEGDV